jgi:hypothetical protein
VPVPQPQGFKALITGTNERDEIRVQFHVVTDEHDQFKRPIAELLKTLTTYKTPAAIKTAVADITHNMANNSTKKTSFPIADHIVFDIVSE